MADIPKSESDQPPYEEWDGDTSDWLEAGPNPPTKLTGRRQGMKLKAMIDNPILLDPDDRWQVADAPKPKSEDWDGDTSGWPEPGPGPASTLSAEQQGEKLRVMFANVIKFKLGPDGTIDYKNE